MANIPDLKEKSFDFIGNIIDYSELDKCKKNLDKSPILITVIIPVFNEELTIKEVINRIPNHVQYEILVIDDGSTDKSVEKANEVNSKDIITIKHGKNLGYGAAILTGFKHATGDIIVTIDSDGQHNPEEINKIVKPIIKNEADIVIGSRYKGNSNYKVPFHTRVGEFIINKCLWLLFHQRVCNNQSGFRAFSRNSLNMFKNMIFSKFGLCTEILYKAASNNLRITEIPISINPRKYGISYVKILKISFSISSCILVYILKKLKLGCLLPKRFYSIIYNKILKYLKNKF